MFCLKSFQFAVLNTAFVVKNPFPSPVDKTFVETKISEQNVFIKSRLFMEYKAKFGRLDKCFI